MILLIFLTVKFSIYIIQYGLFYILLLSVSHFSFKLISKKFRKISILKKIATQSTLYHIWRRRNNILHNQVLIPPNTVFRIIDREVRNILLGRRDRRKYNTLLSSWLQLREMLIETPLLPCNTSLFFLFLPWKYCL